ncbi:MAG: response regulator [Anaerolineales bacterium]|nr:response regulator [Anaerolineales bacterium]
MSATRSTPSTGIEHVIFQWTGIGPHREASTVLIVDDQSIGRDALEGVLLDQAYDLHFAVDGLDALSKATTIVPDVILLDVMMPGMDGFEVCRHLRADPVLKEVPVIMVTALDDRDSRLRGIEAGADDFATKPFDRAELRARVRTITRLNRYRRLLSERLRFMRVVEQAADGYLLLNHHDQILYANLRARQLLGICESADEPQPSRSWNWHAITFNSNRQLPGRVGRPPCWRCTSVSFSSSAQSLHRSSAVGLKSRYWIRIRAARANS